MSAAASARVEVEAFEPGRRERNVRESTAVEAIFLRGLVSWWN